MENIYLCVLEERFDGINLSHMSRLQKQQQQQQNTTANTRTAVREGSRIFHRRTVRRNKKNLTDPNLT